MENTDSLKNSVASVAWNSRRLFSAAIGICGYTSIRTRTLNTRASRQYTNICRVRPHVIDYAEQLCIFYKPLTYSFSAIFDEEACVFTRNGVEGFISQEDISKSIINNTQHHKISLDCLWKIEVEPTSNVRIRME